DAVRDGGGDHGVCGLGELSVLVRQSAGMKRERAGAGVFRQGANGGETQHGWTSGVPSRAVQPVRLVILLSGGAGSKDAARLPDSGDRGAMVVRARLKGAAALSTASVDRGRAGAGDHEPREYRPAADSADVPNAVDRQNGGDGTLGREPKAEDPGRSAVS